MKQIRFKKGQEEMVGFALIIVVVAVILLIFLGFSLRSPGKDTIESYEVESFIQSFLQYTTDCEDNFGVLTIQDLIFECNDAGRCVDERNTCEVLEATMEGITEESWLIGEDRPVRGYSLNMTSSSKNILSLQEGNQTGNSKGSSQVFSRRGDSFNIAFTAYYN